MTAQDLVPPGPGPLQSVHFHSRKQGLRVSDLHNFTQLLRLKPVTGTSLDSRICALKPRGILKTQCGGDDKKIPATPKSPPTRRVPPRGPCRVGTGESGLVLSEEGNPAGLSSCSGGFRPLVELCVEPAGLCGRCTGVAVPLRVVPSPTGLPSKRGPGRIAVLLTLNDPKALVDCPLRLEESIRHHDVSLNLLRLQCSDTKCQLWYFLHLGY